MTITSSSVENQAQLTRIRARLVQIIAGVTILAVIFPGTVYSVGVYQVPFANAIAAGVFLIGLYLLWIILSTINRVQLASYGLLITLLLMSLLPGSLDRMQPILVAIAVATLVSDWRVFSAVSVVLFAIVGYQIYVNAATEQAFVTSLHHVSLLGWMAATIVTVRFFWNALQDTLMDAQRSANLLRSAAEVGQITVGLVALDDLLPRAVDFIRDRFGYYHVQIFLLDEEGRVAWLRASTGEVGEQLLSRRHHLNVGSNSVIGRVTQAGESIIARDTDSAPVHYRNELLPDTRAELALPIRDGDRIIGALDVQSTRANAFPRSDVRALQIMTNLLAASIRNATLFDEQKRNMRENQRLYIEAEANLREIQRLNQQLTRESWQRFVQEHGEGTGVTLENGRRTRDSAWSEPLRRAGQSRTTVTAKEDGRLVVAVPIMLRGEPIGAMEIEPDTDLDEMDTVEIVRAVSERLAVSLDNARLFEESQATTIYEQRINTIVDKYQNASTVDDLLQVTLEELSDTLGAERASIRLGKTFDTQTDDLIVTDDSS